MKCSDYGKFPISGLASVVCVDEVVKAIRSQFEQSLLDNPIDVAGVQVKLSQSITGNSGHRYWFVCPSCGSRVAKLYRQNPVVACRHCLGLKYRSSRYKGMIENSIEQE